MNVPRFLAIFSIALFAIIGLIALFKGKPSQIPEPIFPSVPFEIEIQPEKHMNPVVQKPSLVAYNDRAPVASLAVVVPQENLPEADRINELFQKDGKKLPIVETITYKSRVAWLKGRPAWLSDYATYYQTSRHFIARSLNGRPDYLTQEIRDGDQFNILRKDIPFEFYLLVDASRCKMWFYYIDLATKEPVLLKTYQVGLGRVDSFKTSGSLTPFGKYKLGDKIITYKPKQMGNYQGKKTEMITIFGTRWIPFEKEIGDCTASAKGFGIHGTPWKLQPTGELKDSKQGIGCHESDGCIRLTTADMEELFAIIITKPTIIEIVNTFSKASFLN